MDLTKRRLQLLKTARKRIKALSGEDFEDYAYSDINCNLTVKFNGERHFFNTKRELESILD